MKNFNICDKKNFIIAKYKTNYTEFLYLCNGKTPKKQKSLDYPKTIKTLFLFTINPKSVLKNYEL